MHTWGTSASSSASAGSESDFGCASSDGGRVLPGRLVDPWRDPRPPAKAGGLRRSEEQRQATVVTTVLIARTLLRPWPLFSEAVGDAGAEWKPMASQLPESSQPFGAEHPVSRHPGIGAAQGIVERNWPLWGSALQGDEVPGGSLVLRECLLLCFLQAAAALALCRPLRRGPCSGAVLAPLREGLAYAVVLFGSTHPLAV
ncbi:unnamed protein product, partial [Prorocentrum cordatum]